MRHSPDRSGLRWAALAGLAVVAPPVLLPHLPVSAPLFAAFVGGGGVAAALMTARRARPAGPLFAVGLVALAASHVVMHLRMTTLAGQPRDALAWLGDAASALAYVALLAALLLALRGRAASPFGHLLDGLVMSIGLSVVLGGLVLLPYAEGAGLRTIDDVVMFGCLVGDLLLAWTIVLLMVSGAARATAARLALAAIAANVAADGSHVIAMTRSLPALAPIGDALVLAVFLLAGLAGVAGRQHARDARAEGWSGASAADDSDGDATRATTGLRLASLGSTILLIPLVAGVEFWRANDRFTLLLVAALVAVAVLVIARIWDLVGALERSRQELHHLATHDPLTGLPNRAALMAHFARRERRGTGSREAAIYLDLDGFKRINDTHGHAAGDLVLTAVAEAVRAAAPSGLVARVGGDEFVIVPRETDPAALEALARRLAEATRQVAVDVDGHELRVGASVGLAFAEDGETGDPHALLRRADEAMYGAKRAQAATYREVPER